MDWEFYFLKPIRFEDMPMTYWIIFSKPFWDRYSYHFYLFRLRNSFTLIIQ